MDVRYKLWIRRVKNDQKKAYCILCKRTIDLETGGITAVNSHQGGKRHGDKLKERKKNENRSFFGGGTSSSSTDNGDAGDAGDAHDAGAPGTSSQSFLPYDVGNEATDTEILWCLYMVENHLSYRSNDQLPKLLQRMFRADPVAAKFSMQKDKSRYLVIYGIYPVFQDFQCPHGLELALTKALTNSSRNVKWMLTSAFGTTIRRLSSLPT